MNLLTKAVRGTQDILPADSYKMRFVQDIMLNEAKLYGFKEIRTPVFEHTELFDRGVGDDTDIWLFNTTWNYDENAIYLFYINANFDGSQIGIYDTTGL